MIGKKSDTHHSKESSRFTSRLKNSGILELMLKQGFEMKIIDDRCCLVSSTSHKAKQFLSLCLKSFVSKMFLFIQYNIYVLPYHCLKTKLMGACTNCIKASTSPCVSACL